MCCILIIGSSSGASNTDSITTREVKSNDPAWAFGLQVVGKPNDVLCKLCKKVYKGGINRLKHHVAHMRGNVHPCPNATEEAKKICREALENAQKKKDSVEAKNQQRREEIRLENQMIEDEAHAAELAKIGKKRVREWGPIDAFTQKDPELIIREEQANEQRVESSGKQAKIMDFDPIRKKKMELVHEKVARFAYENAIPFHAFESESFRVLCEAIAQFGPGYRPPTQYMLREPLLHKAVERTKESLKEHEEEWKNNGCTIMTDAWSDKKNRSLFNLCVHCSKGLSFFTSKVVSSESHTGEFIFEWVDECIKEMEGANIIQIVTDNASNNMAAKQLLKEVHPKIFWTSCAAHTIDLMLEGISKLPRFKKVIEKARTLTTFIYAHHQTLEMMRGFTEQKEIVRPGVTRFATSFLTLSSMLEVKESLRRMFSSTNWIKSDWARMEKGKTSNAIVMDFEFWSGVKILLRVYDPLFRLLRVVDSDWKPSMGFVVGMLEDAKNEIKSLYKENVKMYKPILDIIELKGRDRLDSPLHLAAYFLNPHYYYRDDSVKKNAKVKDATITVMEIFYDNDYEVIDKITTVEMVKYKRAVGSLGREAAERGWKKPADVFNPAHWWDLYGGELPYMQGVAMKILNLTSSSSGCERNWSAHEAIQTNKRSRLESDRLKALVYVMFNAKMREREHKSLMNMDRDVLVAPTGRNARAWLVDDVPSDDEVDEAEFESDTEVFPGEGLTWGLVARASGAREASEPRKNPTRACSKMRIGSSSGTGTGVATSTNTRRPSSKGKGKSSLAPMEELEEDLLNEAMGVMDQDEMIRPQAWEDVDDHETRGITRANFDVDDDDLRNVEWDDD